MTEGSVVAVVVTFNRRELLEECIYAIRGQTWPPKKIIVINNGSTDGTQEWLATQPDLTTLTQPNAGGAGGFNTGIRTAAGLEPDWIWCMDDDTIPDPIALEALLGARAVLAQSGTQPALLCSTVRWIDGKPHKMNVGVRKKNAITDQLVNEGFIPMRACTFVSVLLRGDLPERYGLPIKDFFIWADDFEYTARILRFENGYMVEDSKVLHKTKDNYSSIDVGGGRHYYSVRNNIWIIRKSAALTRLEKLSAFQWLIINATLKYLVRHRLSGAALGAVVKGFSDGIFGDPDFSEGHSAKFCHVRQK